ncbi:MAG: hypothetical protein HONBIEJF_02559 [Fimbriimonadaceae bacterium]|nr:hypothetical protein [Fimbriimonadaceae bacterium]
MSRLLATRMATTSTDIIKAAAFLAWNLNSAIDGNDAYQDLSVETVTSAISQGKFTELLNRCDPSRPAEILKEEATASIDDQVRELFEVRGLKYAGATNLPLNICLGFLLAVISNELGSAVEA